MTLKTIFTTIACSIFIITAFYAQNIKVSNISEFDSALKKINAGGTIILSNGIWKDVNLKAFGNGTKNNPIIIKAETPGEVILTGNSSLSIYGNYVIVSGLWFKNGNTSSKYVVQFRKDSNEFANNCRFTNSTISYYETSNSDIKNHWVDIWGKNNRVDHNNFTGKTTEGTTLVVWLKGDEHIENNHQIDYNFFGARPELGRNGGETIRIGTSTNSMKSSKTIIENNTFKNCDGEMEIISNKSCDNIIRGNLFLESKGTLTLRHGNNALVENNVFFGNNVKNTGGIRVINEGHIVQNNLLVGLTGDGYRGPIVIMNGVPNSPLNRYHQVKNVTIQNNTILNCGPLTFGAGKDNEKTLAPLNTIFANNIISNTTSGKIADFEDSVDGITFKGNIVDSEADVDTRYFTKETINWELIKSLPMPSVNNEILKSVQKTAKSPSVDITNSKRDMYVAGAFNLGNTKLPNAIRIRTGPSWKPNIIAPKVEVNKEIEVEPGLGNLRKAIETATNGTVLILKPAIYEIEKKIKVKTSIVIKGSKQGETLIRTKEQLASPIDYIFRVNEGVRLQIEHVTLTGENKNPLKYAIVSPDKYENGSYSIFADYCVFKNFTNSNGGSIYKAYTGTKADTLSFTNSTFKSSYRGLNLSYEKENFGKYNAEIIILKNSVFDHIEEFAVNFARTITDVNIKGGKLFIDHCVFDKVGNTEKARIIRTNGIHNVKITNSVFINSYKIKTPINLSGSFNSISNCLFDKSGFVKVDKGAQKKSILYKNPKWEDKDLFIPSKKSPLLKKNNGIETIGIVRD